MIREEKEGIIISSLSELFLGPVKKYEPIYANEKPDAIVIKNGLIEDIGETTRILSDYSRKDYDIIDCNSKCVALPGFVDSHTHLVFAGDRAHELTLKIQGKSYLDIAKEGGGINYTVRVTRTATKEQLTQLALKRLDEMLLHGTTTIEAKTGYGLTPDSEMKLLEVINELKELHPIEIIPTFLGCHIKPEDFVGNQYEYVEQMIALLPEIRRRNLAEFVDIWIDHEAFTIEEGKAFLTAAKEEGFKLRVHTDEMENVGGAILAANLGAKSADHLLKAEAISASAMAEAGVVANLLPGTPFVLMSKYYANYHMFRDAGVTVALSTDFNPNCYLTNMQTIIGLGCFMMKMTPKEAIEAATHGGAKSLGLEDRIGALDIGMKADVVIIDLPSVDNIPYQFGVNHVKHVIKNGKIVVKDGKRLTEKQKKSRF
ncbi:MAG: imidazolonepropionase [Candidatus Heimdallarchaeaceae archaeon]